MERRPVRLAGRAPQARPREAGPRVGAHHRPVRAEREDRAAAPCRPSGSRPSTCSGRSRSRQLNGPGSSSPTACSGCIDAATPSAAKRAQLGVAQRLDVLDAVRPAAARARRRGRRRALPRPPGRRSRASRTGSPALREAGDDLGVAAGSGQNGSVPSPCGPGSNSQAGAAVDDAVDEELRRPGAPAPAARGRAVRRSAGDLVVADVAARAAAAARSAAVRSPRASSVGDVVEQPRPAEHHVRRR